MKGRDRFTAKEAQRIRELLREVRRSERPEQKRLRREIRAIGFYIDDWPRAATGFTVSDFDDLVTRGLVRIQEH